MSEGSEVAGSDLGFILWHIRKKIYFIFLFYFILILSNIENDKIKPATRYSLPRPMIERSLFRSFSSVVLVIN